MSIKDLLNKYIDKEATVFNGGLTIDVIIKDVKVTWGRERYLICPVAGKGEVWVESVNLKE